MNWSLFKRSSNSQAGIATLTVLVFSSTMLLLVGAMLTYARGFTQTDLSSILLYNSVEMIKKNITQVVYNKAAWEETVEQNQASPNFRMMCFDLDYDDSTLCDHTLVEPISLFTVNAGALEPYYDGTNPTEGFTLDGVPCVNYFATRLQKVPGAPLCVIKVNVSWKPLCGVDCEVPPDRVMIHLAFSTPEPVLAADIEATAKFPTYRLNPEKVDGPIPVWNQFR